MTKQDLRIIKTRTFIRSAFLNLINAKGFLPITIQDIATEAQIGRGTFYLHYHDKYDLLQKLTDEVLTDLAACIQTSFHIQNGVFYVKALEDMLVIVFQHIQDNAMFYKTMLTAEDIPNFQQHLSKFLFEKFKHEFYSLDIDREQLDFPHDMLFSYLANSVVGIIDWWLQNDMMFSAEYMAEKLAALFSQGPLNLIGLTIQ
ncbi:TetR/AcrR family transcriptional regulator [Ectobacillus sp. JY-23]|uniref:TetR/AcrR family transcriptional regulator n=1 Tax=Ectobacillus sp. JY-23 TaxID=2933872 RepID=UPI001FF4B57F|nr:TetR/AcrR family transcriptional regulator [Ectobacillus sp. JY-23]UOY92315.1 TetR/AcrR family transcriptional regulator [Ectobacillus sp. JY-23]